MPNVFITPTLVARTALATLYNQIVLAGLMWRDFDPEFSGAQGDTITVRKPAVFEARDYDRRTGTVLQDITEATTEVRLDRIADVSFPILSEQLTLELSDFRGQVLTPAMEAHAQKLDGDLAEALVDAAQSRAGGGTASMDRVAHDAFVGADGVVARMGRNKAPLTNRYVVFSPEGQGIALADELFLKANESGTTDALRNASIGRVLGFETFMSQTFGLGSGDRGRADGVAFHRTAQILVTRPLALPMGNDRAAVESYRGLSIRVVYDYNRDQKQDEISTDILYGIAEGYPQFAVALDMGAGS